ncbi:Chromatin modification-related YNG2 [Paramuricea clavata]|uniref:Chromatin modification-related YNG2 n=1 Tax=Paramuricea clavata TaxID=317549 RepID=A0A6S7HS11_PARCT|nr:Chromatin modification-related YNG2 [Paramuricea clavata]
MFLETETTPETCVGVVKSHTMHKKNPGQHAGDLEMLANHDEAKFALSGEIDCIRVDGATDEGPSHFEVQFMWTERHLHHGKICTLVTSRFAGGSYLNKVELQNGCLALGHSNLFIPSTIYGSNFVNGELDRKMLVQNLEAALSVYINTVIGAQCGGKPIHLTRGSTDEYSSKVQERRDRLIIFLRGSQKKKKELKEAYPEDYDYFLRIWQVRKDHMIEKLPANYVFLLLPCYKPNCLHAVCTKGLPRKPATWFKDGPPFSFVPLPIPDPARPSGGPCKSCKDNCNGHYLPPERQYEFVKEHGSEYCTQPPSKVLKEFAKNHETCSEEEMEEFSKTCLLSVSDVQMWMKNLNNGKQKKKKQKKAVTANLDEEEGQGDEGDEENDEVY